MIRRINIYGGPGLGKTETAKFLSSELSICGFKNEYVEEYCKKLAYVNYKISTFDEVYFLAKQMRKEDYFLKNGVDRVVCDSPILQVCAYVRRNKEMFFDELLGLAMKFDKVYPSINIFLDRTGIPYKRDGRYEDYEAALTTDKFIKDLLSEMFPDFLTFKTIERDKILEYLKNTL